MAIHSDGDSDPSQSSQFIQQLCLSAVRVQKQWNLAYERELKQFAALAPHFERALGASWQTLGPKRLQIAAMEVSSRFKIQQVRQRGGGIGFFPVHAGAEWFYQSESSNDSLISLKVEQVPILNEQDGKE